MKINNFIAAIALLFSVNTCHAQIINQPSVSIFTGNTGPKYGNFEGVVCFKDVLLHTAPNDGLGGNQVAEDHNCDLWYIDAKGNLNHLSLQGQLWDLAVTGCCPPAIGDFGWMGGLETHISGPY